MNKNKWILSVIILLSMMSCDTEDQLFELVDTDHSGVAFNNELIETESLNILDYEYMYNGGGIGLGDFNNDELLDLIATGNLVANKLYINKGDLRYEDVSAIALDETNRWSHGVAIVDINADGYDDIYICNSKSDDPEERKNQLYINQGPNAEGVPTFIDQAEEYGLADDSYSINSAFFDYDNDGDLDVIIIVNEMGTTRNPGRYNNKSKATFQRVDRLYRNDYSDSLGHPVFTDVSTAAGIKHPGFSLGVNINDINRDGYKDIYITNDFLSDDLMYINNGDGTFSDQSRTYLKHSSHSAMGNDVVDINNDGYDDIIALDMMPEDNYRQKRLLGPTNYSFYLNNEKYDYSYQFARNTLQINPGISSPQDSFSFQDIGYMAGVSSTDWSWAPLVADFDHDGYRDMIITNGFPKDVTDRDYTDYKADAYSFASKELLLSKIPSIKEPNYAYRNVDGYSFENVTTSWGMDMPTFSNGAAFGDLDNDGDLDIIINNINDPISIYRNTVSDRDYGHFISIELIGPSINPDAIGARVEIQYGDQDIQTYEYSPYRGYLSTHDHRIHMGMGDVDTIDMIQVTWPDGRVSLLRDISEVDRDITIDYGSSVDDTMVADASADSPLMVEDHQFDGMHEEWDYVDFNIQALLPHKLSQIGPGLSVADINGDGLDDLYVPGSAYVTEQVYYQRPSGILEPDSLLSGDNDREEQTALFIDLDGDDDLDLFLSVGSYEFSREDTLLRDLVYENRGGTLHEVRVDQMPVLFSGSASAADYDRDGDIDIFVGGRAVPGHYPERADSYLLENTSDETGLQMEVSSQSDLFSDLGNVSDVLWTDVNGDGWQDLMIVGEYMDIQTYVNDQGVLRHMDMGVSGYSGFWNSITPVDIDHDGDMDYIVGNRGDNLAQKINKERPYRVYVKDFDNNEDVDMIPSAYLLDQDGEYREFPTVPRMDMAKEINSTRKKYQTYDAYGRLTIDQLITAETMKQTDIYEVNYVKNSLLLNNGGSFELIPLPKKAQVAPIYGIQSGDYDGDGYVDILLIGNNYGNELVQGRLDAFNGLLLNGTGSTELLPMSIKESGFYVPADGKALVEMHTPRGLSIVAGQNKGQIKKYDLNSQKARTITLDHDEWKISYRLGDKTYTEEHNYGGSYMGQSTRVIDIPIDAVDIVVTDYRGENRPAE